MVPRWPSQPRGSLSVRVCAQFIEIKQLNERMIGREWVAINQEQEHQELMGKNKTEVHQRLQTLRNELETQRLTTPGYPQMQQAIKTAARSITILHESSEKKLEARMDGMDGVINEHDAKWTRGFLAAAASMEAQNTEMGQFDERLKKLEANTELRSENAELRSQVAALLARVNAVEEQQGVEVEVEVEPLYDEV